MKNKINIFGAVAMLFAMGSCTNEDPISSSVTNYAVITLNSGDETIFVNGGESFTDPGAISTVDGEEVPTTVTYTGRYRGNVLTTLDTNISDVYTASYSAVNPDGFSSAATREIIVAKTGDLVNSIEGLYTSTVFRNGTQGAPASNYTDIEYILIWKNDDGSYGISDSFGGWYLFGRAIADSETPGGIIVANDISTNSFSFPGTQVNSYFGGTSEITGMTVDPVAKTINVTNTWVAPGTPPTNYTFTFTLKQVEL